MLVVKLEVWPHGEEAAAREIGRATIRNVGGNQRVADYEWAVAIEGAETRRGAEPEYERSGGPWRLLHHVLDDMLDGDRAKLSRVGELLAANGCNCECEHAWDDHDDCERCLACRISEAIS
jgi:hypothetical protein